jgi:hypothetical protein
MNKCNHRQPQVQGLLVFLILGVFSCQRMPKPQFSYVPADNPEAGEIIQFINETKRGESYEWEFGDGGVSTLSDPQHLFENAGIFSVTLTAVADWGEAALTENITINEPTLLGFIVFDTTQNLLEGANVWVYDDDEAWENREQPLLSGSTDIEGRVSFMNLESETYYIWAFKELNGGTWYFRGYTPALEMNLENWFNVPCIWMPDEPHQ